MIKTELIKQLLDKLIAEVHHSETQWLTIPKYFETNKNEPLRRFIIDNNKYAYSENHPLKLVRDNSPLIISEYRSRCIAIEGGVITLLVFQGCSNDKYALAIQTNDTAGVTILQCDDNQKTQLQELAEIIENEQYEVMKFINRIVEKSGNESING